MPPMESGFRIIRARETSGIGMVIEALGVLFCITIVGAIVGIPLLIVGGRMSCVFRCGNCRNKIDSKQVRLCPTCRSPLLP